MDVQSMSDEVMVQKLWGFVFCDRRFNILGLCGGVRELYRVATGILPDDSYVKRVVRAFWLARGEHHAAPRGTSFGSRPKRRPLEGEPSPWQENAIRALEDGRDV